MDEKQQPRIDRTISEVNVETVVSGLLSIGDYVLATKYSDADPNDPWFIGTIDLIGLDHKGWFIQFNEMVRRWRNYAKLTKEDGKKLLEELKQYR